MRPAPIACQRHLFDLPDEVAFFNCCSQSPLLKAAAAAGSAGLARKLRPWLFRADDYWEEPEKLRRPAARLLGARPEDIAIVPAAGYGIATAAANLALPAGGRVVVLQGQFPANLLPWRERAEQAGGTLVEVPRPAEGTWSDAVVAAIDERCAIAALPAVLWSDGHRLDLDAIAARCRAAGTALVLDLAQSLGALPFDIAAIDPDFVVGVTYKWLLGPYSMGFLYVAPRHRQGRPLEPGFLYRAADPAMARALGWGVAEPLGARRFDVGESANFALLPAAATSLQQILDWGVEAIAASLQAINDRLAGPLSALGLAPAAPPGEQAAHFRGWRLPPAAPADLAARLARRGVHVSVRAGTLRIAPHLHVTDADEARLLDGLAAILSHP